MKKYLIPLLLASLLFSGISCSEEWETPAHIEGKEGNIRIMLNPQTADQIQTRAEATDADSRIEHAIIYVFSADGTRLETRYQQDLEYPDTEISMILPKGNELQLHAICNCPDLWDHTIDDVTDLNNEIISIDQPDGAFNGSMMMHGSAPITAQEIDDKDTPKQITVKRMAAKVLFNVTFDPEVKTDQFYLSQIRVFNIPNRSYIVEREQPDEFAPAMGDAVYNTNPETARTYYLQNMLLSTQETQTSEGKQRYETSFYLFENRRGGINTSTEEGKKEFTDIYPDENEWQFLKAEKGRNQYPLGTYVEIAGTYVADEGATTRSATYTVYLGTNNYGDFNVRRNCTYTVENTIKTCNDLDTRVNATTLNGAQITPSFNNPLDAHYNVTRCFGYTRNTAGWELYVEEPDEHPWLEVSFSPQYRPRIAGETYDDERLIASSRMEGEGALAEYFYIHTDEYVPENPNANESLNNTTQQSSWRTGYVVLRDKGNNTTYRLEVKQRPAQVVKMHVDQLIGDDFDNEYYVEYELEQKNITWGFLKYGANPVMTGMINDRWDGLANTRKLYQEAVKIAEDPTDNSEDSGIYWGAYNGYYTVAETYPRSEDPAKVIDRIPDDHLIKYVLSKNRDRNGNGYIDYDEIVWYVPALDELAELHDAMNEAGRGNVFFQNSEDRFHSSTPYLAGYTDEVPGRAFYVKMGSGDKAFAMRDRQYNVICCRRKGAWLGNNDAGYEGGITTDNEWNNETDIMPKQ